MFRDNVELWRETTKARNVVESNHEWRKWGREIPSLKFDNNWEVRIVPPFGGALVRFNVINDNNWVSVYLDGYDELGWVGEPYWELYPNKHEDCSRYPMNETEALMKEIKELMELKNEDEIEVL